MNRSSASLGRTSKTKLLTRIFAAYAGRRIERVLVVGCGSGIEADEIRDELKCDVIGIDVKDRFDESAKLRVQLEIGDATSMRFENGSFDCVYSYHALEHIPDYHSALKEIHRVLSKDGVYCIGTPNRARLVGYVGINQPFSKKLAWNVVDWRAKLNGRFRNEYGAHAGYSKDELSGILRNVFRSAENVSLDYYKSVYSNYGLVISGLNGVGLGNIIFPAVYFVGRR